MFKTLKAWLIFNHNDLYLLWLNFKDIKAFENSKSLYKEWFTYLFYFLCWLQVVLKMVSQPQPTPQQKEIKKW